MSLGGLAGALVLAFGPRGLLVGLVGHLGVAVGLLSWARLAEQRAGVELGSGLVPGLAGFLAVPVLASRLSQAGVAWVPGPLLRGFVLAGLLVALALGVWSVTVARAGPRTGAWATGLLGWVLALVVAGRWALAVGLPSAERGLVLLGTVGLVAAALTVQWRVARVAGPPWSAWGSPAELTVAGAQLLDGVVTYLAVRDPLGLLEGAFLEQVASSAWLLATVGPGFALLKWGLGLGVVAMVERSPGKRAEGLSRVAVYALVILLGIGPGLFSATRVWLG